MADLTQYLAAKYNKMIAEITTDLGKTADDYARVQNIIRALKTLESIGVECDCHYLPSNATLSS